MFEPGGIVDANSIAPDRFTLVQPLGSGGMGAVYLAFDKLYNLEVALKILKITYSSNTSSTERFLREARLMRDLKHPNIVRTFDIGIYNDYPFFTMEFINGKNLRDLFPGRSVPWHYVANLLRQVAEGLSVVHAAGIIHRDLKCSNILISEGIPKIVDFGAAYITDSDLTLTSDLIGSPVAIPPELMTSKTFGPFTDIFALGVLAYELTTTERPFKGDSIGELFHSLLHEEPVPPITYADMPPEFSRLILLMLAKNPEERPASAEQLIDLLSPSCLSSNAYSMITEPVIEDAMKGPSPKVHPANLITEVTLCTALLLLVNMWAILTCSNLLNLIPLGAYCVSITSMMVVAISYSMLHRRFFRTILGMDHKTSFINIGIRLAVTVYSSFLVILIGLSEVINYQSVESSLVIAGEVGLTGFWCIASLAPCGTAIITPMKYSSSEIPASSSMMIVLFTYLLNWGIVILIVQRALCSTDLERLCNSEAIDKLYRFIVGGFLVELLIVEIISARFGDQSYWLSFLFGTANTTAIYVYLFYIRNIRRDKK